jgi:fatty-acyl-CoA synthase
LIEAEGVTLAAGVPTVWLALLTHVNGNGLRFSSLRRSMVGGSACAPAMVEAFRALGVDVLHGWGMTEMSPLGTLSHIGPQQKSLSIEQQTRLICKQGKVPFGVDMKIVDDAGAELPWTASRRATWTRALGWYRDISARKASMRGSTAGSRPATSRRSIRTATCRSRTAARTSSNPGGEWISSIDIENIALAHPAVAIAACIAVPHPKWTSVRC